MKQIAVLSHVVVDEVHRPQDERVLEQVGGAGAYAAVGASLAGAAGTALLVSGVGRRDRFAIEAWAQLRGIDPAGLFDVGDNSPRTRIDYWEDGERLETPAYGLEHFDEHTPLPRDVPVPPADLAGMYLFHAHEAPYWDEVAASRPFLTGPVMWEISRDSCRPEHLARVRELAATMDLLSLNLSEARDLLRQGDRELPDLLAPIAPIVVLRAGERGSLIIRGSERIGIPALTVDAVDPTGGGNSYSGALLAAYAATGDLGRAGCIASAAAALVVSGVGTPAVDDDARAAVARTASTLIPTE